MKRFIDNKDGTVTDTDTNLMWQKDTAPDKYAWEKAVKYCRELELGGHNDWRLPTVHELHSIIDYSRINPATDPIFGAKSSYYWSFTPYAGDPDGAWYVNFYNGDVYYGVKSGHDYVRAVRAGS